MYSLYLYLIDIYYLCHKFARSISPFNDIYKLPMVLNNDNKPKPHYPQLDIMRGIAIILVVMGHVLILGAEYGRTLIINILTSMHVPAFIFVSGFLSAQSSNIGFRFWVKKIIQLLIPLLFVPPLYLLATDGTWEALFFNEYHAGYWFTYALFLLFLPYTLFCTLASKIKSRVGNKNNSITSFIIDTVIAGPSLMLVLLVEYLLRGNEQITGLLSLSLLSWLYPYLLLGYFVARYEFLHNLYTNKYIVAIALSVAISTIALDFNGYPILRGIPRAMASVCVLYNICIYLSRQNFKFNHIAKQIGMDSLGIYLWHYFFLFAFPMKEWVLYLSLGGKSSFVWELTLTTISATLVLSLTYCIVTILKFNPITRRLLLGSK